MVTQLLVSRQAEMHRNMARCMKSKMLGVTMLTVAIASHRHHASAISGENGIVQADAAKIFLMSRAASNRALHGDTVAGELLG